jgi:twitching motility two-component system response regulator PilG
MSDLSRKVLAVSLERDDLTVVLRTFELARKQFNCQYSLVGIDQINSAELAIVNASDPRTLHKWSVWCSNRRHLISIYLYDNVIPDRAQLAVKRPAQIASMSDALRAAELRLCQYIPNLAIGDNGGSNEQALAGAASQCWQKKTATHTALVVDDSPAVRKAMEMQLLVYGMAAHYVDNGEQAVQLARNQRFDVIFLDVMLPGIDGYEVCKQIRQHSQNRTVPICMLTGKNTMFNRVRGKLAGCDIYLAKPVQSSELKQVIDSLLKQAEQQQRHAVV